MFKKIITTAVLGVSALSIMSANAAAPGLYVTGQLGYGQSSFIQGISPLFPETHTIEDPEQKGKLKDDVPLSDKNNGLAGRLAVGYQFNQNFAVEAGYLQLSRKTVDIYEEKPGETGEYGTIGLKSSDKYSQHAIDINVKGILPMGNNFNVYGKLGAAYFTAVSGSTDYKVKKDDKSTDKSSMNVSVSKWAPEVAVGVSYDMTPNVSIDTSWTHIHPVKLHNVDFVAVGVGYHFG